MNVTHLKFPTAGLRLRAFCMAVAVAVYALAATPTLATADIYNGVYSSAVAGTTSSGNPFVFSQTNFSDAGGEGTASLAFSAFDSTTNGSLNGFSGTQVNSPLLRGISQPTGSDSIALGWVGAMTAYQYNGSTSATVSFAWDLTGILTEPTDTGASRIRIRQSRIAGSDEIVVQVEGLIDSR